MARVVTHRCCGRRNEIDSLPAVTNIGHGLSEDLLLSDELLGSVHRPVEFVWGSDDPMGGIDIGQEFVAKIPGATLEMLDGPGHAPWVDDPGRAAAFVRSSPRTDRSELT